MKTNFALGLTDDGITLWQRDPSGWLRVGAVATDAADLDDQMAGLAKIAQAMAPDGVRTKLVVPDDMLLTCDLAVSARNQEMQAHEIRAQLSGRTPYPVEELDFDWTADDGKAHVVVVARETLIEAEDFARTHGLNPVSYVAALQDAAFGREPFFGTTRCAREFIGDPSALERDQDVLRETGIATLPDPELLDEAPLDPEPVSPEVVETVEPDAPEARATQPDADQPEAAPPMEPGADDAPASSPADASEEKAEETTEQAAAETQSPAELRKAALLAKLTAGKSDTAAAATSKPAPPSSKADTSAKAVAPKDDAAASFRSRRANAPEPAPATAAATGQSGRAQKTALGRALDAAKNVGLAKSFGAREAKDPVSKGDAGATTTAMPKVEIPPRKDPLETLRSHGTRDSASEAERMTIFGARETGGQELSSQRRTLMVLGGVGLLLVAVALWAAYFTFTGRDSVEIAQDTDLGSEEVALAEPLAPESDADQVSSEEIEAALGLENAAGQVPLPPGDQDIAEDSQALDQHDDAAAFDTETTAGRVAVLRSSSLLAPQDAVPLPNAPDAPLPFAEQSQAPSRQDLAALAAEPEAEPDMTEETGLIESLLPEGEDALEIVVSEGTPPAIPPVRPEGIAPEPVAAEPDAAPAPETEPVAEAEPAPEADLTPPETALAPQPMDEGDLVITVTEGSPSAVPPARPASVLQDPPPAPDAPPAEDADAQESAEPEIPESALDDDQATLATPPPGGVALTALRPERRPQTVLDAAPADADDSAAEIAAASAYAVASSLRPGSRPSQFAAIVQRSLAAAQPATPSAPQQQAQATPAAAAPAAVQIPTSASVAREATQRRAINLRQVNLIGVMGTSSSRRALVRLSNGRIVTVRVGESLDGGQVTAIGDTELRYSRRGRNVVLRLAS